MSLYPVRVEESKPHLVVDNITVLRGGIPVLKNVSLKVRRGEFLGIVGPNGGGKSTLVGAILGVLKCQSGSILINGHKPMSSGVKGTVAWVSQSAANIPKNVRLTVRELVSLGMLNSKNWFVPAFFKPTTNVDEAIATVGLEDYASRDVNRLSGGQRQRAVIARALASEAEFLLLDEPMVGMDVLSRNALLRLLDKFCHEHNKTIVMISHDVAAMRQSAHRMIYLEESVRFDGGSAQFPCLEDLAALRGLVDVHSETGQALVWNSVDVYGEES